MARVASPLRILLPLLVPVVLAALAKPTLAGFQEAMAAYARCDFAATLAELVPLATKGSAKSQHQLGIMYQNGKGVARDEAAAAEWYRKAAVQGFVRSQYALGSLHYARGDYDEAERWWLQAARQGSTHAMSSLGFLYADPRVGHADPVKARAWYDLAARGGAADSFRLRAAIDRTMTSEQLARARQLTSRWATAASY